MMRLYIAHVDEHAPLDGNDHDPHANAPINKSFMSAMIIAPNAGVMQ